MRRKTAKAIDLSNREFARVGDVAPGDRSNRRSLDRRHKSRLAVERHELDLDGLAIRIHVNDCSNVADSKLSAGTGSVSTTRSSS